MPTAENRIVIVPEPGGMRPQLFPVVPLPAPRPGRLLAYLAFASICIIWGTTFVGIRVAIETIPTFLVTALRFLSAGLILLVIALITGARFPRGKRDWRDQIIAGILMVAGGNTLVVFAEHSINSGVAALMAATIPIWLALMESILGSSPLTRRKVAGLALGFGGVGLLVAPAIGRLDMSRAFLLAVGAMQLSAICWNAGTLLSRRRVSESDPMANAVVQMIAGGTVVSLVAFLAGDVPSASMFTTRSLSALLYLSIFGSVIAYTAYSYVLTRLSAAKVSTYAYVNPVIAVIAGTLLLSEPLTLRMIVAMLVILSGVAVIQLDRKRSVLAAVASKVSANH